MKNHIQYAMGKIQTMGNSTGLQQLSRKNQKGIETKPTD